MSWDVLSVGVFGMFLNIAFSVLKKKGVFPRDVLSHCPLLCIYIYIDFNYVSWISLRLLKMGSKQELGPHCEHLEINILFNCRTAFHEHVSQSPSKCYLTPCLGGPRRLFGLASKKCTWIERVVIVWCQHDVVFIFDKEHLNWSEFELKLKMNDF